ncbi:hypothetical protein AUC43_17425 [Hymenobacter sedentarius]|uniref:Helix-turn-helix domain-containing protein n=1 Tax=Hymenobacter sedentarius TaxID=1411621 RepID=A0A0U4ATA9_9BACT|nr:helix-turn-helix domain-containing protein [Hymenobacter sedentarius]ALW86704.1 hypothetical protein AUC43_17425 [Hymenobacter sedentarius]
MQFTLTLPPDFVQQLAVHLLTDIRQELARQGATNNALAGKTADLLTSKMVAQRLKVHEKTVIRYIRLGRIHAANHGTLARPKYRVSEADCAAFYVANQA